MLLPRARCIQPITHSKRVNSPRTSHRNRRYTAVNTTSRNDSWVGTPSPNVLKDMRISIVSAPIDLAGRVHTESQYIGPASAGSRSSGGSANNSAASTSNNEQKPYEPSTVDDDFVNEPLAPRVWKNITDEQSVAPDEAFKSPRRRPVYSLDSPIASLRPGGTLKLKLPIKDAHFNSVVLRHEDIRVLKRMESMGIDTKNVPAIHITKGARVGGRRSLLSGTYLVSFPRSGGNRTLFKRQFRRTLAERWLHELESQDPFAFDHLRTEMDAGYRATKHALTGYLINTNVRGRWLLTLQVLWTRQMPEWLRQHGEAP